LTRLRIPSDRTGSNVARGERAARHRHARLEDQERDARAPTAAPGCTGPATTAARAASPAIGVRLAVPPPPPP
jgi:hypothetical protein